MNNILFNIQLFFSTPKDYLYSFIYGSQTVKITPFNPKRYLNGQKIIRDIKKICPKLKVNLIGSTGLKIEGRGDIDLIGAVDKRLLPTYYNKLEKTFGKCSKKRKEYRQWRFYYRGEPVELYITDNKNITYFVQLKLFNLLKNNPDYLYKYRQIKLSLAGSNDRKYVLTRMAFFNQILKSQ